MRGDLEKLTAGEVGLAELAIILSRHRDLATDQTRAINRLGDALLSFRPSRAPPTSPPTRLTQPTTPAKGPATTVECLEMLESRHLR